MTDNPENPIYYALIGDIVGSRTLTDRAEVQRTLEGLLETLNEEFGGPETGGPEKGGAGIGGPEHGGLESGGHQSGGPESGGPEGGGHESGGLATPIRLTAGDELQVLLIDPGRAVDLVVRIADELHPTPMAWGMGAGPISTELGSDVARIDGPCFHHAREAVESAGAGDEWLRTMGFPAPQGQAISALFRLMGAIRSRWKPAQMRYIRGARGHLQREVAELHRVDESTVSKALQAARFRDVEDGEAAARRLLRWVAATMKDPEGGET